MRRGAPGGRGCLVRAAHTGLTWGITLGLFLYPTDLRRQEEQGQLLQPLGFVSLVLCSILLYFIVSLMDPGYVEQEAEEKEGVREEQKAMIPQQVPTALRLRRCGYCMLKQPMRAKHCQDCQHCVRRYDHHCPWIENCVGERNHPLFVVYLTVQMGVLLWALQVAWSLFSTGLGLPVFVRLCFLQQPFCGYPEELHNSVLHHSPTQPRTVWSVTNGWVSACTIALDKRQTVCPQKSALTGRQFLLVIWQKMSPVVDPDMPGREPGTFRSCRECWVTDGAISDISWVQRRGPNLCEQLE